jgi:hypothetical protein
MISEKKLAANRAKGPRSRGPTTPEGKVRQESREAFRAVFDAYVARFSPATKSISPPPPK